MRGVGNVDPNYVVVYFSRRFKMTDENNPGTSEPTQELLNSLDQDADLASLAGAATKLQAASAAAKLKEILQDLETQEGLAKLSNGDLKFEIKPGPGVLWYTAYGTT